MNARPYDLFKFTRRFCDLPAHVQVSRDLDDFKPYLSLVLHATFSPDAPGAGCLIGDFVDCPYHAVIEPFTDEPPTYAALFLGERTHLIVPSGVKT